MSPDTFESIFFVIIATIIVCATVGIGALINHHLVLRRLNRIYPQSHDNHTEQRP